MWFRTKKTKTLPKRITRRAKPRAQRNSAPSVSGRTLRRALPIAGLALLVLAAVLGTRRLEAYVAARDEFQAAPSIILVDVPEGLEDRLMKLVAPVADRPWVDPKLCRDVALTLAESPWVMHVDSVSRDAHARLVINCRYRTPAAMIQSAGEYFVVGPDRVRLPGTYRYHPSLVMVQGVRTPAPPAGVVWDGDELNAGMNIIELLRREPFFEQITAVLVQNHDGLRDKTEPHILLATAPGSSRIAWGSAPGREIEENSLDQKLALLRENFCRWGRIDAGQQYIDISVLPDRFTTR